MISVSPSGQELEVSTNTTCDYLISSAVLVFEDLQINSTSQTSVPGGKDRHVNKFNDFRGALVEECTECYRN